MPQLVRPRSKIRPERKSALGLVLPGHQNVCQPASRRGSIFFKRQTIVLPSHWAAACYFIHAFIKCRRLTVALSWYHRHAPPVLVQQLIALTPSRQALLHTPRRVSGWRSSVLGHLSYMISTWPPENHTEHSTLANPRLELLASQAALGISQQFAPKPLQSGQRPNTVSISTALQEPWWGLKQPPPPKWSALPAAAAGPIAAPILWQCCA